MKLIDNSIHQRPLETAEEDVSRLSGYKGEPISLPYAQCCPIKSLKHLQMQCLNCPTRYCSKECFE